MLHASAKAIEGSTERGEVCLRLITGVFSLIESKKNNLHLRAVLASTKVVEGCRERGEMCLCFVAGVPNHCEIPQ